MDKEYIKLWAREYTVQYCEMCLHCLGPEYKQHIPVVVTDIFFVPEHTSVALYANKQEWQKLLSKIEKTCTSTVGYKKFEGKFNKYGNEYVAMAKKIGKIAFSNVSNAQLIVYHKQYMKAWNTYTSNLWIGYLLNEIVAEKTHAILALKNIPADQKEAVIQSLLNPTKKVGILELQERLLTLKQKYKTTIPQAALLSLLHEYSYISCLDVHNDPWTIQDIKNLYKQTKTASTMLSFKEASNLAHLATHETAFFRFVGQVAVVKDMRDVYRRQGICNILSLYNEIAQRLGVIRKDISYLTSSEIWDCLNNKQVLDISEIRRRQQGFALFWERGKVKISSDPKIISNYVNKLQVDAQTEVIKGITASVGFYKGRVALVKEIKELSKVKKGDVLVTITTHPDFISAMHRAGAIVTDEGGLTSHAAIVSREMKKPCIVGTKTATKVLKDGDIIEVDANKGIVKKLKG